MDFANGEHEPEAKHCNANPTVLDYICMLICVTECACTHIFSSAYHLSLKEVSNLEHYFLK